MRTLVRLSIVMSSESRDIPRSDLSANHGMDSLATINVASG